MPQKEEARGLFRLILSHTALSLAFTLAAVAAAAMLVAGGLLPVRHTMTAVFTAEALGVFLGGLRLSRRASAHRLPVAILMGFFVFLILLISGFLFAFPPERHGFLILLLAIFPALLGGAAGARKTRR